MVKSRQVKGEQAPPPKDMSVPVLSSEENYSQIHREALEIIFAVRKFNNYIYGHMFTRITKVLEKYSVHRP